MAQENVISQPKYATVKMYDTIRGMMDDVCTHDADTVAYRYFEGGEVRDRTYAEFYEDVKALGTALCDLGVQNDHVAMIGNNSYPYVNVYLTMVQSAGVYVPIDKDLPEEDLIHVLDHSDSVAVFCDARYIEVFQRNRERLPKLQYIISVEHPEAGEGYLSYRELLEAGRAAYLAGDRRYDESVGDPAEMRMLVYTSGTTGMSKGVMLSEHNLISCVCYGLEVSDVWDTCLSVLPYHHTYEAIPGLLVAIHEHCTVCINDNLRHVLKNLQLFKPTYIYLVPAFAEMFYKKVWANAKASGKELALKGLIATSNAMRKIGIDKRDVFFKSIHEAFGGRLKKIVCGGAPLRPELGEFFTAIGIELFNGYGITECSPLVSVNQGDTLDCSTVGAPLRCVDLHIDDPADDGTGEICVKGDTVMLGYYKRPDLTREVLSEDGWFATGDYGKINERGQLLITGRKKNLIVLDNGKNIFPEEIENCISAVPYVQEVVVFGIKNADGVETALGAEVFLSQDKLKEKKVTNPEEALKKDIAKACKALPSYKHIARIFIRPTEFEKTTTRKIKRSSLING